MISPWGLGVDQALFCLLLHWTEWDQTDYESEGWKSLFSLCGSMKNFNLDIHLRKKATSTLSDTNMKTIAYKERKKYRKKKMIQHKIQSELKVCKKVFIHYVTA